LWQVLLSSTEMHNPEVITLCLESLAFE